jgi:RimJ/RimL family protein N-acetyltransferase
MIRYCNEDDGRAIGAAVYPCYLPSAHTVISRVRDGKLLGGVIYSEYTGASIQMHIASFDKRWVCRDGLWVVFDYPFTQLGCKKVFGRVPASNEKALAFDLRLGFTLEHTERDAMPDGDLHVLSMYREQCRWLNLRPRGVARGF